MRSSHWLTSMLLVLTAAAPGSGLAGRPLQTEDAGVLDAAACEIEGATQRLRLHGDSSTETGLTFNCGFGWRSQAGLTLSRSHGDGPRSRGAALGGKTGLWSGQGDNASALTLAWTLASSRDDGRWQRSEDEVKLVASVPAGEGTIHGNLGHLRERNPRRTLTSWNLAYEHEGLALGGMTLAPMAEVFGDDRSSPWWNVALRLTLVPERAFVDVSYGRQTGDGKPRLVTAGFKIAF